MVNITDVKQILQFAIDAEIKVFLDGGWGVDALLGYQSRAHNDIDIFVEKKDYQNFIEMMKANDFYEIKMEYTTLNHTVWEDAKNRIVDLHCFEYTGEGEILYEGDNFPVETFSGKGKIEEIEVSCIEPYSQVMFHLGYEFDENEIPTVSAIQENRPVIFDPNSASLIFVNPKTGKMITGTVVSYENQTVHFNAEYPEKTAMLSSGDKIETLTFELDGKIHNYTAEVMMNIDSLLMKLEEVHG